MSDLEAELQKLSMDARCAPEGVRKAHLYDQRLQVPVDLRTPSPIPGLPSPVAAKTRSVPAHERLRPNDVKDLEDGWKPAIQLDEEQAVAIGQPNPAPALTPQHEQLLPEHRILGLKPRV